MSAIPHLRRKDKEIELLKLEVSILRERNTRLNIATKLAAGVLSNGADLNGHPIKATDAIDRALLAADYLIAKSKEGGAD